MANIGLAWVNPAPLTKPENVVNFAKKCEAMGCHSMWTIDRIVYDNLEPLTVLAAAAGATQKIRLGTSVLLANLRHPSHVAKIISTLDFISNGRLTVGLGFGSRENDYKAVEIPFEHRGSRAVEQVQLMKRLWTEDNVTHKGQILQCRESYGRPEADSKAASAHLDRRQRRSRSQTRRHLGEWFYLRQLGDPGFSRDLGKNRRLCQSRRTRPK